MYKFLTILLLAYISLSIAEETSPKQIRQCTCDEMDKCWEETREKFEPCKNDCMEKLTAPELDHDAAMKCFEKNKPERMECKKQMREKMCTIEENKMIDVNETWQAHGKWWHHKKHHHHKNESNEIEENEVQEQDSEHPTEHGHGHGHFKHGFFRFIKRVFGDSGKEFVKCMHYCFRHKRENFNCSKKNNCGVRKLPREEFHAYMKQCMKTDEKQPRLELCQCLKGAGLQKIECDENVLGKDLKS